MQYPKEFSSTPHRWTHCVRAGKKVRKLVLFKAKRELVFVLADCTRILIGNKRRLTEPQLRHLRRKTEEIYDLVNLKTSIVRRRQILQTRGFLGAILEPALGLLALLVGSLIRK